LYPNPNNGTFTLETSSAKGDLIVFNLLGSEVHRQTLSGTKNQVSVAHLPNGIYLVQFSANGMVQTKKVMIR
jgi:hypothetical protein